MTELSRRISSLSQRNPGELCLGAFCALQLFLEYTNCFPFMDCGCLSNSVYVFLQECMPGFIYKSCLVSMDNDPSSWFLTVSDEMSRISKSVRLASFKYSLLSDKLGQTSHHEFWMLKRFSNSLGWVKILRSNLEKEKQIPKICHGNQSKSIKIAAGNLNPKTRATA